MANEETTNKPASVPSFHKGAKRIIVNKEKELDSSKSELQQIPDIDVLLDSALAVIDKEMRNLLRKANKCPLETAEAKTLQGYIKSLLDIQKAERDAIRDQDLSKLSIDELVAKVKEVK